MSGFKRMLAVLCLAASATATTPLAHADPIFVGGLQLHERDLNGDGVVDAYYDSVFGLTWLRDWNYVHSRQPTIPGLMNWPTALAFADFVGTDSRFDPALGGHEGWRLPTMQEFVYVFDAIPYMENVQEGYYWSADVYRPFPELTYSFQPLNVTAPSGQVFEFTELLHVALVRTGDVLPEPSTDVLVLLALGAMGLATRRQRPPGSARPVGLGRDSMSQPRHAVAVGQ